MEKCQVGRWMYIWVGGWMELMVVEMCRWIDWWVGGWLNRRVNG